MSAENRLLWLKRVLGAKVVLTIFAWGLPALLAPMSLLQMLGIPTPSSPLFVRFFGSVVTAFGIAYWYAYKDPVRNVAILKAGIVDNALATLVVAVMCFTAGLASVFIWISGVLTGFFFLSFWVLMPKVERA